MNSPLLYVFNALHLHIRLTVSDIRNRLFSFMLQLNDLSFKKVFRNAIISKKTTPRAMLLFAYEKRCFMRFETIRHAKLLVVLLELLIM